MTTAALFALVGVASSASALVLSSGPTYTLPGGGSCTVSGVASQTGGATIACTGVILGAHTHVYFGIRNDINVNGNTMTGSAPAAASAAVFRINSTTVNSITYTSTTSVASANPGLGTQTVSNQLVLTLTAGVASVVATGGNPANSANNGDIADLFQITSGTSFTIRADVKASDPNFGLGQASPAVYDPSHSTAGAGGEISKVDVAFYYSDCGDGQLDSPEQCDQGSGVNGTAGSCCSSTCTFKANLTACTDDGNQCTNDQCNGASPICQHPNKTNGTACTGNGSSECSGADTCQSGVCANNDVASGTACTDASPPSSGNCKKAECNGSGTCDQNFANESNGTSCNDGLFCDGADSCNAGLCSNHAGDPCPGPNGDGNCSESCNEAADNCTAPDPNGSACDDGLFCDGADTCNGGACALHSGDPCLPLNTSDGNCAASCNEGADNCTAPDPNGTGCSDGVFCDGADTCSSGACTQHAGDPCLPLNTTDANCSASCNEGASSCTAPDPNGTGCDDGLFCTGTDSCSGGSCATHSGDPCPGPNGDTNCSESCNESADDCTAADPDGSPCRPAVDLCDLAETCSSGSCPSDQVEPSGHVCRTGSGDACDPNEVCDGSSSSCPPDTFLPSGSVCRPGSGDICDPPEVCPGVAAGTCAADVVAPPTTVCNPGSGDLCDPDEHCTGTAGQPCPTDSFASSSTVCRPAAGFCDLAETCPGTPDAPCPAADAKKSSSTPCRPAVDACDVAENCDGVSNNCPANLFQPDNTSCSDGQFCNGPETCQSGACTPGAPPCTMTCDEINNVCLATGCQLAPESMCRTSLKSLLLIKNKSPDSKDKLIWKWIKGASTSQAEFGDPVSTADYSLCIYSGLSPALVANVDVLHDNVKWTPIGTKGYKYLDLMGSQDGAQKILVKGSTANKSKALMKGGGGNLPDPLDNVMMLDLPVKVQLVNHSSGVCLESNFSMPKKNTATLFKAKQ